MAAVGFEPTPPKRLVPKTSALDRSATLPFHFICTVCSEFFEYVHAVTSLRCNFHLDCGIPKVCRISSTVCSPLRVYWPPSQPARVEMAGLTKACSFLHRRSTDKRVSFNWELNNWEETMSFITISFVFISRLKRWISDTAKMQTSGSW